MKSHKDVELNVKNHKVKIQTCHQPNFLALLTEIYTLEEIKNVVRIF
jgi:hypothetical protein